MKIKFIGIALAAALAPGCATYSKQLDTWVGAHSDELISKWGPPDSAAQLSNGGSVLQYKRSGVLSLPGHTYSAPQTTFHQGAANAYGPGGYAHGSYTGTSTTSVQQTTPGMQIPTSCTTTFTVDSSGVITQWNYRGNGC